MGAKLVSAVIGACFCGGVRVAPDIILTRVLHCWPPFPRLGRADRARSVEASQLGAGPAHVPAGTAKGMDGETVAAKRKQYAKARSGELAPQAIITCVEVASLPPVLGRGRGGSLVFGSRSGPRRCECQ